MSLVVFLILVPRGNYVPLLFFVKESSRVCSVAMRSFRKEASSSGADAGCS